MRVRTFAVGPVEGDGGYSVFKERSGRGLLDLAGGGSVEEISGRGAMMQEREGFFAAATFVFQAGSAGAGGAAGDRLTSGRVSSGPLTRDCIASGPFVGIS